MLRRAVLLLPFLATSASAHSARHGDIKIGHAWALPAQAGLDGQCFMPLLNAGKQEDALVAARSDLCLFIELRRNARYDDAPDTQIALAPNRPVAMRPQATHMRLVGLRQALKPGDHFPLILDFLNAGEFELEVHVETAPGD
jgi:periplasmic copper chaperone A